MSLTHAQKTISLSGKVLEAGTDQALPYATISVVNVENDELINGGIADESGLFSLKIEPGEYRIDFEYIGFEPTSTRPIKFVQTIDLGNIFLEPKSTELEGVDVVGQQAELEIRLDKRIYNVSQSLVTKGGTVSDVLENVPSVSVDMSTDEHPTTWSATFNETQSQDIEPANISTAQEVTTNKYTRGKDGLLKSVKYEYNEDGSVNWRAMVDPKHLFPNKSWFEARNKAVPTSVDGLQDYQLFSQRLFIIFY